MTDRELLELAAKADGHKYPWFEARSGQMREWNPLKYDGDALRLAVKLGIDLRCSLLVSPCCSNRVAAVAWTANVNCSEIASDDNYATTRRAIVRAAAEIGKAMP